MPELDRDFIDHSISKLSEDFVSHPNKYLTEDDVRIHLCKLLLKKFGEIETTRDGDCSIPLHTEVRWYGKGTLKYRSDIVLIDVTTLDVKRSFEMPSKGYSFNIPKAIIELKFRRPNGDSDRVFRRSVENDFEKLTKIKSELSSVSNNILTWVIAFDKKRNIMNFNIENDEINFIYKFSNVTDEDRTNPFYGRRNRRYRL
jgi:hypothetical protein